MAAVSLKVESQGGIPAQLLSDFQESGVADLAQDLGLFPQGAGAGTQSYLPVVSCISDVFMDYTLFPESSSFVRMHNFMSRFYSISFFVLMFTPSALDSSSCSADFTTSLFSSYIIIPT